MLLQTKKFMQRTLSFPHEGKGACSNIITLQSLLLKPLKTPPRVISRLYHGPSRGTQTNRHVFIILGAKELQGSLLPGWSVGLRDLQSSWLHLSLLRVTFPINYSYDRCHITTPAPFLLILSCSDHVMLTSYISHVEFVPVALLQLVSIKHYSLELSILELLQNPLFDLDPSRCLSS